MQTLHDPDAPLRLNRLQDVLFATLDRPASRNALAPEMVSALTAAVCLAQDDTTVRALVLRGSQGFFCAGGNVGNFEDRLQATKTGAQLNDDPVAAHNRTFGHFMQQLATLPVPVLAVVEGGAFGGGMGLACAADIVLAQRDAQFALTETTLGLIPAQIAPFVVERIGRRASRRLGLSGERVRNEVAVQLGLVDALARDTDELDQLLAEQLTRLCACAPGANRALKSLLQECGVTPRERLLDQAAQSFAQCMRSEGAEGIAAFRARRPASWQRAFSTADVQRACS